MMKNTALPVSMALLLTACSSLTKVETSPPITLPAQYAQASQAMSGERIEQWWHTWNNRQLAQLIEQGLQQGSEIKIAKSRLDEVSAMLKIVKADLSPTISADALIGSGHSDMAIADHKKIRGGGLMAAWEPDIWGQKQSDIDAARATAWAVKMRTYGAQMLVASSIAENYLRAGHVLAQQALLEQTVATLTRLKHYVEGRFDAGQASTYDVQTIRTKIQAVKSRQATLKAQFATHERSIAVLTGAIPQGFHLDKQQLAQSELFLQLPLPPSGEQPDDLLARRPDLMAAAANVQAKAAALASAKADFLPRFDLRFLWQTGRVELSSALLADLDGWGSVASFGAQLPIFTAGKIRANVNAKDAALKTALLEYNHAILQALAEVDNRYQLQYALARQVSEITHTVDNNQQREVSIQKLFKYGDKTLDDVIRVQLETLQYQQELLAARLASGLNLIALYKAIGSGWSE